MLIRIQNHSKTSQTAVSGRQSRAGGLILTSWCKTLDPKLLLVESCSSSQCVSLNKSQIKEVWPLRAQSPDCEPDLFSPASLMLLETLKPDEQHRNHMLVKCLAVHILLDTYSNWSQRRSGCGTRLGRRRRENEIIRAWQRWFVSASLILRRWNASLRLICFTRCSQISFSFLIIEASLHRTASDETFKGAIQQYRKFSFCLRWRFLIEPHVMMNSS